MTRTVTTTQGGGIISDISNLSIPFVFVLTQKSLEKKMNDKKPLKQKTPSKQQNKSSKQQNKSSKQQNKSSKKTSK